MRRLWQSLPRLHGTCLRPVIKSMTTRRSLSALKSVRSLYGNAQSTASRTMRSGYAAKTILNIKASGGAEMQSEDWRWIIGQAIIAVGLFVAQYTRLSSRIDKKTDELHSRVNEVRDNYVKTSDLDKNLQRIDGSVSEMRREMHAMQEALAKKIDEMTKTIIETRVETAKLNGHKAAD